MLADLVSGLATQQSDNDVVLHPTCRHTCFYITQVTAHGSTPKITIREILKNFERKQENKVREIRISSLNIC